MTLQTFYELIVMRYGFGNSTQYIGIALNLLIEIAGNARKIIQGTPEILDDHRQIRIDAGKGRVGTTQSSLKLPIHVGGQQPFSQRASVVQIGCGGRQVANHRSGAEGHKVEVRGQTGTVGQHGRKLIG